MKQSVITPSISLEEAKRIAKKWKSVSYEGDSRFYVTNRARRGFEAAFGPYIEQIYETWGRYNQIELGRIAKYGPANEGYDYYLRITEHVEQEEAEVQRVIDGIDVNIDSDEEFRNSVPDINSNNTHTTHTMETTTKSTTTTITDVIAAGKRFETDTKRRSMCDYLRDTHHIDDSYTVISYDWTPQYDRCCIAMTRNGNLLICQINSLGHGDWDAYTRFIDLSKPRDVANIIVMLMFTA